MYRNFLLVTIPISIALFFFSFAGPTRAENPFDEAKLTLSLTSLSLPKIYTRESDLLDYKLSYSLGAAFELDLPIWRYLHSGFLVRYLVSPKKGDIGGIVDLSGVLKPMLGFESSVGHFAFYLSTVAGLSVTFMPIINKAFALSQDELKDQGSINRHVNVFGGLLNTSAKLGAQYYPMSQFGIFVEGGFAYWFFLHQIDEKLFQPTFKMFSYHMTGIIADAGIKFIF